MIIDLKAIRATAEAATPGPWETTCNHPGSVMTKGGKPIATCSMQGGLIDMQANVNHIANLNPATVIDLLDRLEAAEKDAARYRYLRESNSVTGKGVGSSVKSGWFVNLSYESLDAAIDAAMKEQK